MKSLPFKKSLLVALVSAIGMSSAFATQTGYGFVYAYSYALKQGYRSAIFVHPVNGKSLNDKEYISDIRLIRRIEDAFERHLQTKLHLDPSLFSVSAQTGFKTREIAKHRMDNEMANLRTQGIETKLLPDFTFKAE